jgi:hypothetical protein
LCGNLAKERLSSILKNTKHKQLKKWETENIPYTIRKERLEFLNNDIQKVEIDSSI